MPPRSHRRAYVVGNSVIWRGRTGELAVNSSREDLLLLPARGRAGNFLNENLANWRDDVSEMQVDGLVRLHPLRNLIIGLRQALN